MLKLALPPLKGAVANVVVPCLKLTLPVGVPPNCTLTAAVKVTVWPTNEGFGEDVSVVRLVALETLCEIAAEVLALKLLSPA